MGKKKEVIGNLKRKENEAEQLKNQLIRALADYDNLSKRIEKEKDEIFKFASINVINKLLPVFDMLVKVQTHLKDSGLAIAINEFKNIFKEEGIIEIEVKSGDTFDEKLHEAIEAIPGSKEQEGKVEEVVLSGWKFIDGSVIRHTRVKVYKRL
jgi:molecular chaperone GrpE